MKQMKQVKSWKPGMMMLCIALAMVLAAGCGTVGNGGNAVQQQAEDGKQAANDLKNDVKRDVDNMKNDVKNMVREEKEMLQDDKNAVKHELDGGK